MIEILANVKFCTEGAVSANKSPGTKATSLVKVNVPVVDPDENVIEPIETPFLVIVKVELLTDPAIFALAYFVLAAVIVADLAITT